MSKYLYRIFTIIDLHFGAMQPCSSGLGMTLEASDFSIRPKIGRLLYYLSVENTYSVQSHNAENTNSSILFRHYLFSRSLLQCFPQQSFTFL